MMKHIAAALVLLIATGTGAALADDDCHVPMDQWQPREAVQKMAELRGWQVGKIKIDDGCYEIKGLDETGKTFKAKIDPATLSIVKIKRKEQDKHEERKQRQPSQSDLGGSPSNFPSNKLFEAGNLPKTTVK